MFHLVSPSLQISLVGLPGLVLGFCVGVGFFGCVWFVCVGVVFCFGFCYQGDLIAIYTNSSS